ncbi:hypothetical protein NC652_007376 [Populus alba x Populus x berolinensis]|nr:hypothetical protein NC652_007376 [Populus alba x Populus x berolinensis]
MAIFQTKYFMILLCLVGVFMGTPGLAGRSVAPSGEPMPKLSKYIAGCAAKLTGKCGAEIFHSFSGNNNNPSDSYCHNAFTEFLESKEPQENPSKISLRSLDIWNHCVAVAAKP